MKITDIKIQERFKNSPPSEQKLHECRNYYRQHGVIDRELIVNTNGYLVDGYVGYLVLLENGVEDVDVTFTNQSSVSRKTYVFGCHDGNDKEYVWRVPKKFKTNSIKVGSNILVQTRFGIKTITVTRIESSYVPPVATPIKSVIQCLTT